MPEKIDMIFFDIEGVLIDYRSDIFYAMLGEAAGANSDELKRVLYSSDKYRELWNDFQRGGMSDRFHLGVKEILEPHDFWKSDFSIKDFRNLFTDSQLFEVLRKTADLTDVLRRAGYPLGIISNIDWFTWKFFEKEMSGLFSVFNPKILSFETGLIKPEREIWEMATKEAGKVLGKKIKPENCIFLDDREENVLSASKFGMNTIQYLAFSRKQDVYRELKTLGVNFREAAMREFL